jgi:AraC-like DNA-binding protein
MQQLISTAILPERDQFSYWREECMKRMVGVTLERGERDAFLGSMNVALRPSLVRIQMSMQAGPYLVTRSASDVARQGWGDWMFLIGQSDDTATYQQLGDEPERLGARDLLLCDASTPTQTTGNVGHVDLWMLPRALIEPHLPAGQRPIWRRIVGKSGIDALIRSYHDSLSEQMDSLSEGDLGAVVDNFCRLLAIGCGVPVQEQAGAIHASQLETIKQFVKRHLRDPSMTPAIVAQEARISVRQLHRIFEPTGTSFAQFILSQRLDACLASLIRASNNGRSVAEIAYGWGFNSLPTFYRAFARRFGESPRAIRASAQARASCMP